MQTSHTPIPLDQLAASFIAAVVEEHPTGSYNNPTSLEGGIFAKLISDHLMNEYTDLDDLITFVRRHSRSTEVTFDGRSSNLPVMIYILNHLQVINEAISQHTDGWVSIDGSKQVQFMWPKQYRG